jgi:hypothetical protein
MSARVAGWSGRFPGGSEYSVSRGLEEPERHEPGLRLGVAQGLDRHGGDLVGVGGADLDDSVEADLLRVLGDVLLADLDRVVAGPAQGVHPVLGDVVELPATVGEAEHSVLVAVLAGQQAGAAARAGGGDAERLPEQDPLIGEQLDVRGRDLVPVRLHEPARVVGMDVEDVRLAHGGG